jgi:hypothetical protein
MSSNIITQVLLLTFYLGFKLRNLIDTYTAFRKKKNYTEINITIFTEWLFIRARRLKNQEAKTV